MSQLLIVNEKTREMRLYRNHQFICLAYRTNPNKHICLQNNIEIYCKGILQIQIICRQKYNNFCMETIKEANRCLRERNLDEAIRIYRSVIQNDASQTNQLAALYNLAQAHIQQKRFSLAVQCYHKILEINPNYKPEVIYYELGQAHQLDKKDQECITAYSKHLERFPNDPQCNFNLALAYDILSRYDQAHRFYQRAYTPNNTYTKTYTRAMRQRANLLIKQYRYEEAIPLCDQALTNQPNDPGLHYFKGVSYLRLNRLQKAQASLMQCIRCDKNHVRAYITLAEVKCRLGDNSGNELLQRFTVQNAVKPTERKEIIYWQGIFQMRMGRFQQAIQRFREVLRYKPIMESAKVKLGECLEQEGNSSFKNKNYRDALNLYQQALGYVPENKVLLNNMGLAYQRMLNFTEAERFYNRVLKEYPNDAKALNNLAVLKETMGNKQQARKLLQKVIQDRPQNYEAHLHKGKLLMSSHNFQQAIKVYKIAEAIKDNDFDLHNDIAVALEHLGRYQEALHHANIANSLTNNLSPLFLVNRASIFMHLNKRTEASKDLNRANRQIRKPDSNNSLWLNTGNRRFIETQLNRYAGLMDPIEEIREEIVKQELEMKFNNVSPPEQLQDLKEKMDVILTYIMNQTIGLIKKDEFTCTEELKLNATVNDYINNLQNQFNTLRKEMFNRMQRLENERQNAPQKIYAKRLEQLKVKDPIIWQYGKQLYWYLYTYLMGYMFANGGILAAGSNIDRSAFNSALQTMGNIMQYAQCIPVIGQFSEIVSRICRIFVGLEDDVIIKKVFQVISHNYNCQQQLHDEIYTIVVMFLREPSKVSKVRYNLIFNPQPQGFFDRFRARLEEVGKWLENKKNEFVMYMRGYQNVEQVKQAQLAALDVGLMISAMLKMETKTGERQRALVDAAQYVLTACRLEDMVVEAYQKDEKKISQNQKGQKIASSEEKPEEESVGTSVENSEEKSVGKSEEQLTGKSVENLVEKIKQPEEKSAAEKQQQKPREEDKNEDSCNLI